MFLNLSVNLEKQHKIEEAEVVDRERMTLARENAANDPELLETCLYSLADTVYRRKKYAEAEPFYRELIQRRRSRLSPGAEDVVKPMASLGRLLANWAWAERSNSVAADVRRLKSNSELGIGESLLTSAATRPADRAREAERLLRECLAFQLAPKKTNATVVVRASYSGKFEHRVSATRITDTEPWRLGDTRSRLGGAVLSVAFTDPVLGADARESRLIEAETLLIEGNEALQQSSSADRKYKRDALERLVRLYDAWDKPAQAAAWRTKLEQFEQTGAEKKSAATQEARP
jgi:hypothetical protein